MAYNTKPIKTDKDGNPISQYYNPQTDEYEPVEGASGGNKVIIYNEDGTPNNSLNFGEVLDKLDQLKGTVIDEETRKQNEQTRQQNEQDRIDLYNALKDLDVSQYELRLQKLEHDTSVEETVVEEAYGPVIPLPENVVNGQINDIILKGITLTNSAKNGSFEDDFNNWMKSPTDSNIVIDTERTLFGNKSVKIITNNNQRYIAQNIDGSIGDKFYVSVWCKKESGEDALATILPKGQIAGAILTIMRFNDFNNMPTGEWRRFSGIAEATNDGITILFGRAGSVTYEVNFDGIVVINMTQLGIEDYTKEQMDSIVQNYFEGTKSTFGAIRLKSVGKNLFDYREFLKNPLVSLREYEGRKCLAWVNGPTNPRDLLKGKFKDNTQYTITWCGKTDSTQSPYVPLYVYYTDGTSKISTSINWSKQTLITDANKTISHLGGVHYYSGVFSYYDIDSFQIEEGTTATPYEPYKESVAYITAKDESGNIFELRSLPNGTKDEINVANRKLIKRIEVKSNITSGTIINFTDMAEGGTYYAWNDNGETETGTKGDTLGINATVLTYQLAEPEIIPVEVFGSLQSYENGTVYVDTIVPRVDFYTSEGIVLEENEPPIKEIDVLYLVDKETGVLTSLDISKSFIFPDGKGFTHPDLYNAALVDWDYIPDVEGTNPTILMKLPTNLKASVTSALQGVQELSNKTKNLDTRVIANHRDIYNLQGDFVALQSDVFGISNELDTHKAEDVSQTGGVHGLIYEEGEFTPYITFGTVDDNQYSIQEGNYIKIGNLVHVSLSVRLSAKTTSVTSGELSIRGLPFALKSSDSIDFGMSVSYVDFKTGTQVLGRVASNRLIPVVAESNTAPKLLDYQDVSNIAYFKANFSYITD